MTLGEDLCTAPDRRALTETLRVAAVEGDQVHLVGDRAAGCRSCAARAGCGAGALTEVIGGQLRVSVPLTLPVSVGDEVAVALPGATFLGAAALTYLLPPAALALTAGIGAGLGWSDIVTAALCLPVFALTLLPIVRAERRGRVAAELSILGVARRAGGAVP
ncbi:MAG: SoxR reducing system RseC family protein [Pseudomonadota bacterium]